MNRSVSKMLSLLLCLVLLLAALPVSAKASDQVYEMRSMSNYGVTESEYTNGFWGQFRYTRNKVKHVIFQSSFDGINQKAWDVSAKKNRTVMAWMDGDTLYVGADGVIAPNKNASQLFARFGKLEDIDFGGCFDTTEVTDMSRMFYHCDKLDRLDLTIFRTDKVKNMRSMFTGCNALEKIDVGSFDTNKVTNMSEMFMSCTSLERLDLSSFETPRLTNTKNMFYNCKNLEVLDISRFSSRSITEHTQMFKKCKNLTWMIDSDSTFVDWANEA